MRIIKKGATSQSLYFEVLDSTSTSGGRKTGVAYNTSGLSAYYVRNGGSATSITLATLANANSSWSSGGFKEVDATNMPGLYRLDVPDAAFAAGADSVIVTIKGVTGMAQVSHLVQLTAVDLQDASQYLTQQITESYATNGTAPTLAQAVMAIHQHLMSFAISGSTKTVYKLDNSTTAYSETLDSSSAPTSLKRT